MSRIRLYAAPLCALLAAVGVGFWAWSLKPGVASKPALPLMQGTSREELDAAERVARARVEADAADGPAVVRLSEILLRKARVESNPEDAIEAERVLRALLDAQPGEYSALKQLGAVYLSQHRFAEAADVARRALRINERDAWNYGMLGDANTELGRYDEAFEAFNTMVRLRPDAASYARVAYAHELQGRLSEALRHMQMAAEATSAHDPESLAWHYTQVGNIYFQMGRIDEAAREYARAQYVFPRHPYARAGLARVAAARGAFDMALDRYRALLNETPTPELAATVGDLLRVTGDPSAANEMYERAESLEREGWKSEEPQPAALARMLAERGRDTEEAVALAERGARGRSDIFTMDALAWAYYRAGRIPDAHKASMQARRTGTVDRRIVCHGAVIDEALKGLGASRGTDGTQCRFELWVTEPEAQLASLGR
ncbi:MAG: tetratricopeptide repeat protein [Acidobacteria bacterium]|nr:tetratricopeptide repeat protein [Acidobacteriota bacterium]